MKSFIFKGYPSEIQSNSFSMNWFVIQWFWTQRITALNVYFGHFCIDCNFKVYFVGGRRRPTSKIILYHYLLYLKPTPDRSSALKAARIYFFLVPTKSGHSRWRCLVNEPRCEFARNEQTSRPCEWAVRANEPSERMSHSWAYEPWCEFASRWHTAPPGISRFRRNYNSAVE